MSATSPPGDRLAEPDHLVVAAVSLDAGAAWCEATFGVAPVPGGRHAFMGTHNRLLAIGSAAYPGTYLEIIAIDPEAPATRRARWFGLDDPVVRDAIAAGPRPRAATHRGRRGGKRRGRRRSVAAREKQSCGSGAGASGTRGAAARSTAPGSYRHCMR